ncbi:unnamed protein product [Discosporangium mesarthrocarpum]
MANRKLRKILRGARPPIFAPAVKSLDLESILRRNRAEQAAACRVQRFYKHYYRRKKFTDLLRQLRLVVRLQALVRGVLARRYVAEWYARRTGMVLAWQTIIRRTLSNLHWSRRLKIEEAAATRIQAMVKGRTGLRRARRIRASLAALRIQCLWRGCVDRARVDRLWLDGKAVVIQGLARVLVARRKVASRRRIYWHAARTIQRCFRGRVAREAKNRLMWERELRVRCDFLRALAAEEDWERENIQISERRIARMGLRERLDQALQAEGAAHKEVYLHEVGEARGMGRELQMQRQMLSPRALEQGWKEELDDNVLQHRAWVTKNKLEAVFEAALPARRLEEEVGGCCVWG